MICDAFLSWKRDSGRHFLLLVRFSFISILPFYLKFSDSIKISGVYGIFQLKSNISGLYIAYYCCPIKSIEYKRISLGHCILNGRVLFCYSKPLQKIDS